MRESSADPVNRPSERCQKALHRHAQARLRSSNRRLSLAVIAAVGLLALAVFLTGCSAPKAVRDGIVAIDSDLPFLLENMTPDPQLSPDEQKLPEAEQTRLKTDRHNKVRELEEQVKKTAHMLEELTR